MQQWALKGKLNLL